MIDKMTKFEKLIVLTLLMILDTLSVYASTVIKVRSGAERSLECDSMSGFYEWTIDDRMIRTNTGGIDSTTVNRRILIISHMTGELVGVYECRSNDGQVQNTFDVKIVGLARYNICQKGQRHCSQNVTYSSTSDPIQLDASITFDNGGTDCCNETLLDPEWMVIHPPGNINNGQEVRGTTVVNPPGIRVTTETSVDSATNVATVTIISANDSFQIMHLIHTNIDGGDGQQISIMFDFNYIEGTVTATMTSSSGSPTPSAMSMTPSMPSNMLPSSTSTTSPVTETRPDSSTSTMSSNSVTLSDTTNVPPSSSTADTRGLENDDDGSNTGVIVGVVVSLLIIVIVGGVVVTLAVIYWHYHNRQDNYDPAPGQSEAKHSNDSNGTAHRPTNIQLNSNTPLLNLIGSSAYTTTNETPQQIMGAPILYGNASNEISNELPQDVDGEVEVEDVDGEVEEVDDGDLDQTTNDSSPVNI